jgi:hypothetical protein
LKELAEKGAKAERESNQAAKKLTQMARKTAIEERKLEWKRGAGRLLDFAQR